MKDTHTTKDGKTMLISAMTDKHLMNTIKLIKRMARDGIVIRHGGCGPCGDDMWYDESTLLGEDVLQHLNFYAYDCELAARGKCLCSGH